MALITQKIKFVLFVLSVGKRKKPCYPHGQQSLAKVKFSNETFSQSMMFVL